MQFYSRSVVVGDHSCGSESIEQCLTLAGSRLLGGEPAVKKPAGWDFLGIRGFASGVLRGALVYIIENMFGILASRPRDLPGTIC